ncbi:MAG: hypothetical protein PHO33_04330 [Clostridia bacterium]|nr:hypothetical protein [Clostridia bacterium]
MKKDIKQSNKSNAEPVKVQSKKKIVNWYWSIKILFLSFALSMSFSILSEMAMSSATIFIAILVIILLLSIGIIFDMVGVAMTAGNIEPFLAMASKKVRGAKESILLLKNAEKVSVFCCDIVGDICGILCGASGAAIVIKIVQESSNPSLTILISSLVSAMIACITIFGKSIEKGYAVNRSEKIIFTVGKLMSIFNKK